MALRVSFQQEGIQHNFWLLSPPCQCLGNTQVFKSALLYRISLVVRLGHKLPSEVVTAEGKETNRSCEVRERAALGKKS